MEPAPDHELPMAKLFVSPLPPTQLSRPQLIQKMNEATAYKLTLLCAPAGYGKTTLLCAWAAQATHPVIWLSLNEAENDPIRFWTYIMTACRTVHTEIDPHILHRPQQPEQSPLEVSITSFINMLALSPQSFTLIIDDYHFITETAVHRTLRLLLDRQPSQLHLILSSRTDPPLALAARRVRRELVELRTADLRFTAEEVAHWLTHTIRLSLSPSQITALTERTEGWIAALCLAVLSLQESADRDKHLAQFTGSHRYIIDYLLEEVLASQPEEVQTFLFSTACLDRFTSSLCNTLTGRNDGQSMLESLERANLFLIPLDEQRHWYRYHHLFAEAVRVRAQHALESEQRIRMYRQASIWYEQHGLLNEASSSEARRAIVRSATQSV